MTKDVKTYLDNFGNIDFSVIGCPKCGSLMVVCNGSYFRKRAGVYIQRLKCKKCGACPGWMPPFLLRYKHYPIPEILPVIKKYLLGAHGYLTVWVNSPEGEFSFSTFMRWLKTLSGMAHNLHKIARETIASLKPNWKFEKDKRLFSACFPAVNNSNLNLLYKIFILQDYFVFESVSTEDFFVWLIFASRNQRYMAVHPGDG